MFKSLSEHCHKRPLQCCPCISCCGIRLWAASDNLSFQNVFQAHLVDTKMLIWLCYDMLGPRSANACPNKNKNVEKRKRRHSDHKDQGSCYIFILHMIGHPNSHRGQASCPQKLTRFVEQGFRTLLFFGTTVGYQGSWPPPAASMNQAECSRSYVPKRSISSRDHISTPTTPKAIINTHNVANHPEDSIKPSGRTRIHEYINIFSDRIWT